MTGKPNEPRRESRTDRVARVDPARIAAVELAARRMRRRVLADLATAIFLAPGRLLAAAMPARPLGGGALDRGRRRLR
jgi:hypothetical protein